MKRPALIPGLAIALGVLSAYFFKISSQTVLFLLVILIFICILSIISHKPVRYLCLIIVFLMAMLHTNNHMRTQLLGYSQGENYFTGVIHKVHEREGYDSYDIIIHSINRDLVNESSRINLYRGEKLEMGSLVSFNGEIREPESNTNPGLFNYRQYLLTKGIKRTIRVDESTLNAVEDSPDTGYALRNSFKRRIDKVYMEGLSQENSNLMKGLITGDKDSLSEGEYDIYKEIGLAHILAISGLHIGILSGFVLFILSRIGLKRPVAIPLALIFVWVFGYLTGYSESALRASIMLTLLMGSRLIHRPFDTVNILAVSFIACLVINPIMIFSIGFQLSFVAAFSLAVVSPWVMERLYPAKGKLARSVSAVVAANIGILPLQAYYFNQLPILTLLSNIIVLPLTTLNLVLGFVMLAFPIVGPVLDFLLQIQRFIVFSIHDLPIQTLSLASPGVEQIAIYLVIVVVVIHWDHIRYASTNIRKVVVMSLIFISLFNLLQATDSKQAEIHFIDVGQGDSALIRLGDANYLLDTGGSLYGSFDPGRSITLPYLQKLGLDKLDGIIISHFHEDHYKGIFPLLENIKVNALFINGEIPDAELALDIDKRGIPVYVMNQGSSLEFGDGSKLECIWPYRDSREYQNENNNSLVIKLESKGRNILFTGDIEADVEELLTGDLDFKVDVLKVAHHGSKTSSTHGFISKISPNHSIISAGRNNSFGHPNISTLQTLQKNGVAVHRTDETGLIKVQIHGNNLEIIPYKGPMYQENLNPFIFDNLLVLSWMLIYYILSYMVTRVYIKLEEEDNELRGFY